MSKKRTQYTPKQKTAIAATAIAEKRTQAQLSSDYKVHASQIKQWKQQALPPLKMTLWVIMLNKPNLTKN